MTGENVVNELQIKAAEIAERCERDPEFLKQVRDNPRATLEANGIPPEYVNDVIGQTPKGQECFISCITTGDTSQILCICCQTGSC